MRCPRRTSRGAGTPTDLAASGAGVFVVTVHDETCAGGGCNVVARYHGAWRRRGRPDRP
jgi:hypothetical protein